MTPASSGPKLQHLVKMSRAAHVTLQVLPFDAGPHATPQSAFRVLGFAEPVDPDVVSIELRAGTLYLEDPAEIEIYTLLFDHLRAAALSPTKSAALLSRIATSL